MSRTHKERSHLLLMRDSIRVGLRELNDSTDWLEEYEQWKNSELNHFDSLIEVRDPFDLKNAGDRHIFDMSNQDDLLDLDVICMSVFLSERLLCLLRQTFSDVRQERNREKKQKTIEHYFEIVKYIAESRNLAGCIITLNESAEKQLVLHGGRSLDLYATFFSLKENLRKRSTEALFLQYTYWRITKSKPALKDLTSSIIDYIQTYFEEYDKDPNMRLFYPLNGLMVIKKLAVISHWLEFIAFHTDGIFAKYKNLKWLYPVDRMADEIIETNQISKYEMYLYKTFFANDDDKTVRNKAICNHGYAIWIKTVDVMYIVCDIFQVLYSFSDDNLKKMNASRSAVLDGYDNMTKIRDYYTRKVFFHQVYYQHERKYFDSRIMDALEEDAKRIADSVDDIIGFANGIASDDIETLLQAKQRYIKGISDYISNAQEERLDILTLQIVEKIKSTIQKLGVYDTLYRAVSNEFLPYAGTLMQHPQIFSSLVSAEYLYQQYVERKDANPKFDYSCISIMYYMSLEDFLNKLVYTPYANEVLSVISESNLHDDKWKKKDAKNYVSSFFKFWDKTSRKFKSTCEIGNLGFLFENINKETYFEKFVSSKYPKTDFERFRNLGIKLKRIAPRRNDAAHGGNYLSYEDVCTDKDHIYNISGNEYKGMIMELLDIIL